MWPGFNIETKCMEMSALLVMAGNIDSDDETTHPSCFSSRHMRHRDSFLFVPLPEKAGPGGSVHADWM